MGRWYNPRRQVRRKFQLRLTIDMPTLTDIIVEYALASASHLWWIVPGVLMTVPDTINWFRVREMSFPRWLKLTMFMLGLLAAQFLAYRDVRLNLQTEINQSSSIAEENATLETLVQSRRHSLDTTEPVFPNIIYLLKAFRMYRFAIGHDTKCTVYITAPPGSTQFASMVAQVSIATSNCATFGPHGDQLTPTLEKEALEGSVPGVITIHAAEHDRAADKLLNSLASVFRVKRGYKPIAQGRLADSVPSNYIWLQFGANTRPGSELREQEEGTIKQQ